MMRTITWVALISMHICGMDIIVKSDTHEKIAEIPLSLSQLPIYRQQLDDFFYVVKNNAAHLHVLVAKQNTYCSQLSRAEETLHHAMHTMEHCNFSSESAFIKMLNEECDEESYAFIIAIAKKADLCKKLIQTIDTALTAESIANFKKFQAILSINRYVANHYFIDPNSQCRMTPLHYVIQYLSNSEQGMKYIEILLHAGAHPSASDTDGNSPLHKARNEKVIRLLLRFGAQANRQNKWGDTPLISYIHNGNENNNYNVGIASYLIQSKVSLDVQDGAGNSALHHAVYKNNRTLIRMLLEYGAHFDLQNKHKERPFSKKSRRDHKKIVVPYLQQSLCNALAYNDCATVQKLVQQFPWMSFVVDERPIIEWAQQECVRDSKVLESVHVFRRSLSQLLFSVHHHQAVRLISAGAQVNQPSSTGILPLLWAIGLQDKKKISVLLQNGAIVTEEMIRLACNKDAKDIVALLQHVYDQQLQSTSPVHT